MAAKPFKLVLGQYSKTSNLVNFIQVFNLMRDINLRFIRRVDDSHKKIQSNSIPPEFSLFDCVVSGLRKVPYRGGRVAEQVKRWVLNWDEAPESHPAPSKYPEGCISSSPLDFSVALEASKWAMAVGNPAFIGASRQRHKNLKTKQLHSKET